MMEQLIIDGHVHIHDCFNLDRLLDGASANFGQVAYKLAASTYYSLLLLTESAGADVFSHLHRHISSPSSISSNWQFEPTTEANSLLARGPRGKTLYLIAGRQIITTENLEVLGYGLVGDHSNGAPLHQVIAEINQAGGVVVLPWGFGKWTGARGKLVGSVITQTESDNFFLGDNGNRPYFMPLSKFFTIAAERGIRNIPGTDPLPFKTEMMRPGSYGLTLQAEFHPERPAQSALRALRNRTHTLHPYGYQESALRFCRNQVAMQVVKRTRKSPC